MNIKYVLIRSLKHSSERGRKRKEKQADELVCMRIYIDTKYVQNYPGKCIAINWVDTY